MERRLQRGLGQEQTVTMGKAESPTQTFSSLEQKGKFETMHTSCTHGRDPRELSDLPKWLTPPPVTHSLLSMCSTHYMTIIHVSILCFSRLSLLYF